MYKQGRYSEVLDLSDFLIGRNRKNSTAWYLKGIAYTKTGKTKEAIDAWTTGLNAQPQDELMRFAMELEVRELLSLENNKRKQFAQYHVDNARQYKTRYDGSGAIYEYQRALLLDPVNYESRAAYADILKLNGMNELYLEQLKFIKDHNYQSLSQAKKTDLDDKIEAYDSLLEDTLAKMDNPPLTWDELKQMEGKPVWVEGSAFADGFWIIPNYFGKTGDSEYFFAEGNQFWKENMGDMDNGLSWQAYRKERE